MSILPNQYTSSNFCKIELETVQISVTQMDSEASNRQPKQSKGAQTPSNSIQDSNLTIPILPPELITEILTRLPVKSLLKFRSVSKSWLALISSPQFIKTHLSLSANNKEDTTHMLILGLNGDNWNFKECPLKSLFHDSVIEALDLDYPIQNTCGSIRIGGSCNGLILLDDYSESSLLWNPTTRIHKNLPDFRPTWKKYRAIYGFGYDELHDDYKVLGIFYDYCGSSGVEVKIYSLKSDSWTSVGFCEEILNTLGSYRIIQLTGSGSFANGKLHWDTITFIYDPSPNMCRGRHIIAFDLANEKWEKVEKPSYGEGESQLFVGRLGSDLSIFCDYKRTHVGAWVMKEYGVKESWIKMFTIKWYPNDPGWYPTFCMTNKGEILLVFGSTFMIYNSTDDSFRYLDVINHECCDSKEIYIESLVCPFPTEVTEKATKARRRKLRSKQSSNK